MWYRTLVKFQTKVSKMKKLSIAVLLLAVLLTGCISASGQRDYQQYTYEIPGVFDTVVQVIIYAENEKQAQGYVQVAQERLGELHCLYDKYNSYPGLNNIKTINDNAGLKPVEVAEEIIDLILFAKEWYEKTGHKVNIALGPVINIWHDYRQQGSINPEKAQLPSREELEKASTYTDLNKVIVDERNKTVFLQEKGMNLDLGAVAKGYATEIVARELEVQGATSMIISSGGNVKLIGKPLTRNKNKWGVAIQNPLLNDGKTQNDPLDIVFSTDTSLVTSGDYNRYYQVDGEIYHHIIDPSTLMPANHYRAVTVMVKDSGIADFMSTTLFLLPFDESWTLASEIPGLEALWVFPDGHLEATPGMKGVMKGLGGATAQ